MVSRAASWRAAVMRGGPPLAIIHGGVPAHETGFFAPIDFPQCRSPGSRTSLVSSNSSRTRTMYAEHAIQTEAASIAAGYEQHIARLERELADIESRKHQIKQQLHLVSLIPKRLSRFQPKVGADYQCPRCWLEQERHAVLQPIGWGTTHEDHFRCGSCGHRVTVQFRE